MEISQAGNLLVLDAAGVVHWSSQSACPSGVPPGSGSFSYCLPDWGELLLLHSSGQQTWSSQGAQCSPTAPKQLLSRGVQAVSCIADAQELLSASCSHRLTMSQPRGLLQLLASGSSQPLWLAGRQFEADASHRVCVQADGALVYSDNGGSHVLWSSGAAAAGPGSGPFTALIRDGWLQVRGIGSGWVKARCTLCQQQAGRPQRQAGLSALPAGPGWRVARLSSVHN
jgi:hypothetical protein